jgi:hypothetical protein
VVVSLRRRSDVGLMEPLASSSSSSVELDKASCGSPSPAPGQQGCSTTGTTKVANEPRWCW